MFNIIAQRKVRKVQEPPTISLYGFSKGLNTFDAANAIEKDELASALNYYLNKKGKLVPRPGITQFTTATLSGNPYSAVGFKIGSDLVDIVNTVTGEIYKISTVGVRTLLGTAAGKSDLFIYGDACAVCDGSYLKFIDSAGILVQAFDAGEDNGLYDKLDETSTDTIKIHTGQIRAGVNVAFPTYSGGFKTPLFEIQARAKKTGTPTGSLIAKLYQGTSLLATSSNTIDISTLLTTEQTITFNFTVNNAVQTGWMASNTGYRMVLEYTGGDSSNCLELSTINDGDTDGTNYTTTWVNSLYSPLMWLAPNLPPKVSFGVTALKRPFFGGDPDNPGYVWYGNVSLKDFSTPNGGGWIGVVDNNRTTYPVGGLGVLFGDLYAFGKDEMPYLSKLTGSQPSDYALLDTYKGISATYKTIINTPNDVWFSKLTGTNNLQGVKEFGDLRTYSQAQKILDRFDDNWDDDNINFAGLYKELGLYLLQIKDASNVLVCHTNLPYQNSLVENDVGYPWTEFVFENTPTMFGQGSLDFLIGMDDGHIYKFDITKIKDDSTDITFNWRTAFVDMPFGFVDLEILHLIASSKGGLNFDLNIYTESDYVTPVQTIEASVNQSGLLVDDATLLLDDATQFVADSTNPPIYPVNIRCSTVQLEGDRLNRFFYSATNIAGCLLRYKVLET